MRSPGVKAAVALEPYVVRVVFANGEVRDVDIEPILDGPVFRVLRDPAVFGRVAVDECGETVTWPHGADLDPEVLYGSEKRPDADLGSRLPSGSEPPPGREASSR